MKPIVFRYKNYRNLLYPIITIEVAGHKTRKSIDAYVDSGASISIFSGEEAKRLGLNLANGRKMFVTIGDGSSIPVYLFRLPVKIGEISFNAILGFSERLGVGFNLIGRRDIFERFDITFSDAAQTISFLPRK